MREKRDSIFKLLLECLDIVSTHNTLTLIILEGIENHFLEQGCICLNKEIDCFFVPIKKYITKILL